MGCINCVPPDDAFEEGGNGEGGNRNEEELGDNWNPSHEYQVSLLICLSVCLSVCHLVCLPVEASMSVGLPVLLITNVLGMNEVESPFCHRQLN